MSSILQYFVDLADHSNSILLHSLMLALNPEQTALSKGGKSMLSFEYSFLFCILHVSVYHCYFGLSITIYSAINDQRSILLELSHRVNPLLKVDDFNINSLFNSTE